MFANPVSVTVALAVSVLALLYFFIRVQRQRRGLIERNAQIEKLRSELASADASMFRLTDRIAQLESAADQHARNTIVRVFPDRKVSGGIG